MKKKILLIEDDAKVVGALKARLASEYDVEIAEDGQSGYYAISEQKPNVVLLDVTIGQMDPIALMGKIRAQKRFQNLPFFILADSFPNDRAEEAMRGGARGAFSKAEPNYVSDVVREISEFLNPMALRGGRPGVSARVEVPSAHSAAPSGRNGEAITNSRHAPSELAPIASLVQPDVEPVTNDAEQLRQLFATSFSARIHAARQAFVVYMTAKDGASRASGFEKFYKSIASLKAEAAQCELAGLMRLLDPLERRARELRENVEGASAATRQVFANAIDFMASMNHQGSDLPALNHLSPAALVMDDEAVSRRAISRGLE